MQEDNYLAIKAIGDMWKQELKDKLLEIMIQTAKFNPSITLNKTHCSFTNKATDIME